MNEVTLYHRRASGKIKVWKCRVEGSWVISEWGQQDGTMSTTREQAKYKEGFSLAHTALILFERKVQKRKKSGFVETLNKVVADVRVADTDFNFDRLSKSFAPAKPIKKIDPDEMAEWDSKGLIFIQRKRDGMRHYLVSDTKGQLKVYSSGKDDMTEHLAALIKGVSLPPRTILDCELVVTEPGKNEKDGFLIVSGIARSLGPRAQSQIRLAQGLGAKVELLAFDLLWLEGQPIYREPYEGRYRQLARVIDEAQTHSINYRVGTGLRRMPLVSISRTRLATMGQALNLVTKHKWEGLVLWRKDQATVVQVNGTPKRVNCWKLKPVGEEDVVALNYELGKGKNRDVVGKFNLALVNKHGKFIPMGRCGSGLDDDTRTEALRWKYPCVIHIEYDQISEKGFRFPIFKRKRDDKKPAECVVD